MSDSLSLAQSLENLRCCVWGIASVQTNRASLFEDAEFYPLRWTKEHGISSGEWTKCVRSVKELAHSIRTNYSCRRGTKLFESMQRRRAEREIYAAKFREIVGRMFEEWLEANAGRRPELVCRIRVRLDSEGIPQKTYLVPSSLKFGLGNFDTSKGNKATFLEAAAGTMTEEEAYELERNINEVCEQC